MPSLAPTPQRLRTRDEILAGLCLLALAMMIIGFRGGIVSLCPHMATAYAALGLPVNLRGLSLEHFHTVTSNDGFQTVLGIEGEIRNLRPRETLVPPIELSILDSEQRVLYSWQVAAPVPRLAPYQSLAFRARLSAPPAAGAAVLIRFRPKAAFSLARVWQTLVRYF